MALLARLPTASVDAIVTDPPYSSGGAFRGDRAQKTGSKYLRARKAAPDFEGDTRDQLSHLAWCVVWLSQALRVAKPGAPVVVFCDWRQLALAHIALQAAGWVLRGVRPWCKKGAGRPQLGRFRADSEFAVWGSKGPMSRDRRVGGVSQVLPGYTVAAPVNYTRRVHQTEKPPEVMAEVVRICEPGGVVLDPFVGGGSTGVAALTEGYRFLGAELVAFYAEQAQARCAALLSA